MAFKFDSEVDHVHSFRAIVKEAVSLGEDIDRNLLTPDEAFAALQAFISKNPVPDAPPKVKKAQADAKKAA